MNVNKKARELMTKYPKGITVGQLQDNVPNEKHRRVILSRMVYFAQCEENEKIFGRNLLEG